MTTPKIEPVLSEAEWHLLQYEATPVSLPLILKLGAHHGAWPMPRDPRECPCCGGRKDEQSQPGQQRLEATP